MSLSMCHLSASALDALLKRGKVYEVGGAVRDRLMTGRSPQKDRDYLVTGIPYDELTGILKRHGRVDLVGKSFGVIKFTQLSHTFDITLPRREFSTGVGHADFEVDFDPALPVEVDLSRRDFTINAMAVDVENETVIDPLGGLKDIERRLLRMTSPRSFEEDPLRMLRAMQFAARFGFEIEAETLASLKQQAPLISSVSAERIQEEMNKLLEHSDKPSHGFRLMQQTGLLDHLFPELALCVGVTQPGPFHTYDVFEHIMHTLDAAPKNLRIRLAALFHDITKPQHRRLVDGGATFYSHEISGARIAKRVMSRWRYSRKLTDEVATLVERHMYTHDVTDKGLRRLIRRVGLDLIFDLLDLRRADIVGQGKGGTGKDVDEFERRIREELDRKPPFGIADLALSGLDVMRLRDIPPGPLVGYILNALLEAVLDDPSQNTVEGLTSLVMAYDLNNPRVVRSDSELEMDDESQKETDL